MPSRPVRKLVLAELNEINFAIVKQFARLYPGRHPRLERLWRAAWSVRPPIPCTRSLKSVDPAGFCAQRLHLCRAPKLSAW
jgi:hypothetical protein